MHQSDLNSAAEPDLGYGQLFAILLRRRFVLLSVFCTVVSFAATATMMMKPTYESQMQLLVEPNYPEKETLGVEEPQRQFSKSQLEIAYATQLTLMESSEFMEKAVEILRLEYPTLEVADIEKNFEISLVEADKNPTKIVKTVYNDNDPIKTQKILQALQKIYQDYNLEQDKLRYTRGLVVINRELPVARQRLLQAERSIEEFRRKHNVIDPEQQAQAVTEALNAIERDRQAIRAQYQEIEANYNILQQQIALDPREALLASRLSESSRYQNLLDAIQETELELAQRRLTYRSADPTIKMLLEQRTSQLELLQQEVQRVLGKLSSQLNLTGESLLQEGQLGSTELELTRQLIETRIELLGVEARQQSIAAAEQELRAQLASFPSLIAEYNSLQPEVEIQMETIKQLLEKQQELSLELARGGFNWQVVEAPQLGKKTGPSIKRNILLGTVVGLFLGGVAAFLGEAVDDTIHTASDLQRLGTIPVLGVIPEIPQQRTRGSIINLPLGKAKVMELTMMEKMNWLPLQDAIDWVYNNIEML
ncbi:MAG: GumC family protein, partial [Hormoscilla sp.]